MLLGSLLIGVVRGDVELGHCLIQNVKKLGYIFILAEAFFEGEA